MLQLCVRGSGGDAAGSVILTPGMVAPVDGIARAVLGRSLRAGPTDGLNHAVSRQGRNIPWRFRARLTASVINDIGPIWIPDSLVRELAAFKPDVIHSLLGGVRPMRLAYGLSKRLDIPLVPHFMDDWIDNLFADGQLFGLAHSAVDRSLSNVLSRAPLCLTIGDDMRSEYAERLRRPCVAVGNSVDVAEYQALGRRPSAQSEPRRLRYVGGLHLGRADVIRSVARVLARRDSQHRPWQVELCVPEPDIPLARALAGENSSVHLLGSVMPSDVPQTLVDADAVLFIESAAPSINRFTRLSVSTKVPQYLASGRPVLVVGPEDQSSVRALRDSGACYFAGDGLDGDMVHAVMQKLEESDLLDQSLLPADTVQWIGERYGVQGTREKLRSSLELAVALGPA